MNSRELFQLAVRILGLVFLFLALRAIPVAISLFFASFPHDPVPGVHEPMNFGRMWSAFIMVAWPLLLAWWLIRGAPLLMRIAFRERPASAA